MLRENPISPRYFRVQRLCFQNIGIDLRGKQYIVTNYVLSTMPISALFAAFVAIVHFTVKNIKDVDEFTKALEPFWQITIALLKWCTFMYKRHEVVRFVKRIWSWNLEVNEAELEFIITENKKDIYFCRLYLSLVAFTGYFALVNPLLKALVIYFIDGKFYLEPVIKMTYPWDIENLIGYGLSEVWLFVAIYSLVYISVGIDSLFSWLTHNIIAHFGILEMRFRQAALEYDGHSATESITECIKYHCRILEVIKELNAVFSFVMFCKFSISCLQVCFLAFQLSRIKNFADAAFDAGFLICVAVQLILYCRNAQRIRDKGLNIADSIYLNFEWEKLSKGCQKLLLFAIARSQRDCNLSGIFFNIDLNLYMWVFKTAGSYLALLTTMDEQ